jgi:hypothetical protein
LQHLQVKRDPNFLDRGSAHVADAVVRSLSPALVKKLVEHVLPREKPPKRITPEMMEQLCQPPGADLATRPLSFPYEFPKPGRYRIWVQVKAGGKVRLLAQFEDFHGWDLHAMWDDIKFVTQHCRDVERIALVGDKKWEQWMAKVCKPFTMANLKYFDVSEIESAWNWLAEAA